ncbi:MAG: thioredoxin [Candidatus Aenigmatarchaeota archaeon]
MTEIVVKGKDEFEEKVVEKSKEVPVLADFWAEWCMPCKNLSPTLDEIADEFEGRIVLAKINVAENKDLAGEYGVRSIPNVKLFKNGEAVDEFTGARNKDFITEWLEEKL